MKPLQLTMRAFGAYAGEQIIDFTLLGDKNFFLIHGPTGSGKTTILDAISFALYGSASGDLRESKNLRSDYAPAEQKTEVEFTFKSGEYIYQVLRAPEQELKKQRGEGTRKVPAAAALFKILTDGSKEPLAAKSDEVTKKITELIGFKAEQFRQIVLLPRRIPTVSDRRIERPQVYSRNDLQNRAVPAYRSTAGRTQHCYRQRL